MYYKKCTILDYKALQNLREKVLYPPQSIFDFVRSLYFKKNTILIGCFDTDARLIGYLYAVDGKYVTLPRDNIEWYSKCNKMHIETIVVDPFLHESQQRKIVHELLLELENMSVYNHIDVFLEIRNTKIKKWIYNYGFTTEGVLDTDTYYDLVILGKQNI